MNFLGLAYYALDKSKDARKAFEQAIKLRPNFAPSHASLAYLLLQTNKLNDAGKEASLALGLDANNATAHYILGAVNLRQGKPRVALQEADAALAAQADLGAALLMKSEALVALFDDNSEVTAPSHLEPRYHFLKEAAQVLETFFRLYPNDPDAGYWREQLDTLRLYSTLPDRVEGVDPNAVYHPNQVKVPARILSRPTPLYTEEARRNGDQGTVRLRAIFSFDGRVKNILALNHLNGGLTEQAIRAAQGIKFLPATIDGRPVSQFVVIEYNFNIY